MIQNRNMAISQAYSRRLRPKKEDSAGKWIAVSALVVIFVCVCIGIGLIGVYSIRSANQLDSASVGVLEVAPDAGDDAKNRGR